MADLATRQMMGCEVVPEEGKSIGVYRMDLTDIFWAETRIADIERTNPHTAPELLKVFNQAYSALNTHISHLEYELRRAEREVQKIKARLLIDDIPELVKNKGLANSKDIRDALIEGNADFQKAQDRVDQITACQALLKGKRVSIEMAHGSVKKILGETNFFMGGAATKQQLNGMLEESKTAGDVQDDNLFGRPDYTNNRRY